MLDLLDAPADVDVGLDPAIAAVADHFGGGQLAFATPGALARHIDPRTVETPALELIDAKLVAAYNGSGSKRLIITMPPQEGKSQRISRFFPTWLLKQNPDLRIAQVSYGDSIAMRWGRQVRNDIAAHPKLGLVVRNDTAAAKEWQLSGKDGGMITTSIGGSLTGRPVDVMVIDDPHKDQQDADSETMRENVKEFWRSTASTRLGPGAICVVVMTRWHEDDLAGFLVSAQNENADAWEIVNIPAQAVHDPDRGHECKCGQGRDGKMTCLGYDILGRAPGEFMASARGRTPQQWAERRREMGKRAWNALCQGWPAPSDGNILLRSWWQYHKTASKAVRRADGSMHAIGVGQIIMTVDAAFKDTTKSDFVAIGIWARRGPKMWLLDLLVDRMAFPATLAAIRTMLAKWPQVKLKLIEEKANGAALIQVLRKDIGGIVAINPTESKESRAHTAAPFVEAGDVSLPEDAPFTEGFVDECAAFPNGAHDDQVDCFTMAAIRFLVDGAGGADFLAELEAEQRSPSTQDGHGMTSWQTNPDDDDDDGPYAALSRR